MKCGHCKQDHKYNFEVRACAKRQQAIAEKAEAKLEELSRKTVEPPTGAQLDYIADLAKKKGIKNYKVPTSRRTASETIEWLKRQPAQKVEGQPGSIISFLAANMIQDGRYAVRLDNKTQPIFVIAKRPKMGSYTNRLVLSTQHGPQYVRRLVFDLTTQKCEFQHNRLIDGHRLADVITAVVVNQNQAALDYATEKGVCHRCARELTDERSVFYGVGPECEKMVPSYVAWVEDVKGPFGG